MRFRGPEALKDRIFNPHPVTFSPTLRPRKSFSGNTYGSPRRCCKQKSYGRAKSFSCNTYKKQGGGGPPFAPLALHHSSLVTFFVLSFKTLPSSVSRNSFTCHWVEKSLHLCLAGLRIRWFDPIAESSELPKHLRSAELLRSFGDRWAPFFVTDSLVQDQPNQPALSMGDGSDSLIVSRARD